MSKFIMAKLTCWITGHRWAPFSGRFFDSQCDRCLVLRKTGAWGTLKATKQ